MKKIFFLIFLIPYVAMTQPNCEAYKHYGDTLKYLACKKSEEIKGHFQFSRHFQEILDESIKIDPSYDYAWRAKSVAYVKSGDFLTWKMLMDEAVALNPKAHLGHRGWCRYQFFRDYEGAIADIELLDSLVDYDIGYSANANYHLNIGKAICYKAIGQKAKAISIIRKQLDVKAYEPGFYDYLHLAILYLEMRKPDKALKYFRMQFEQNELAENQYYLGILFKSKGKFIIAQEHFAKAKELYLAQKRMHDHYTHPYDKVYLAEIEKELKTAH